MPTMEKTKRLKPTNQKANRIFPIESWWGLLRYLPPMFSFPARPISGDRPSRREGRPSSDGRLIRELGGIFSKGKDRCERPSVGQVIGLGERSGDGGTSPIIWLRERTLATVGFGRWIGSVLGKFAGPDGLAWMRRGRRLQNIAVR